MTQWRIGRSRTNSSVAQSGIGGRGSGQRGEASDQINREPVNDSRSECLAPLAPFGERGRG